METFIECLDELIAWVSVALEAKAQRADVLRAARNLCETMFVAMSHVPVHLQELFQIFLYCVSPEREYSDAELRGLRDVLCLLRDCGRRATFDEAQDIVGQLRRAGFVFPRRYLCERCGGRGRQGVAKLCDLCKGEGLLGAVSNGETV